MSESPLSFLQDLKEVTQIERKPLTYAGAEHRSGPGVCALP